MKYVALLLLFLLAACHSRPVEELTLADVAVRAAQKVKADALAPDTFRQAENYFLRAKRDYSEGYYDSCRKFSTEARLLAEQAEYKALLKQSQLRSKADDETPPPASEPPAGGGPGGAGGPSGEPPPDPNQGPPPQ